MYCDSKTIMDASQLSGIIMLVNKHQEAAGNFMFIHTTLTLKYRDKNMNLNGYKLLFKYK